MKSFNILITLIITYLLSINLLTANIIYVKYNASGSNDGTSWANAYTDLQSALSAAVSHDTICVATGTYKPDASSRSIAFTLIDSCTILGGFAGNETIDSITIADRDFVTNETILSGDLNDNDTGFTNNSENSYHVVSGSGVNSSAVLDGFTIKGGNANGSYPNYDGGGITIVSGSPTLRNLIFYNNHAKRNGGAINNMLGNTHISDALFYNNRAEYGGAIYTTNSTPVFINLTVSNNSLTKTTGKGGGIFNNGNCTYVNVLLWNNEGRDFHVSSGTPSMSYCLIDGSGGSSNWNSLYGTDDGHNIDQNPLFVDTDSGDYRLIKGSPALDSGNTTYGNNIGYYQGAGVEIPYIMAPNKTIDFGGTLIDSSTDENNYYIEAYNLTSDLTIIAPDDFEITLTPGDYSGNTDSLVISPTGGYISDSIFARFTPTIKQSYSDVITHKATDAKTKEIPVIGYVLNPYISLTYDTLLFDSTKLYDMSPELSYNLQGDSLISDVTIIAPPGFIISTTSGDYSQDSSTITLSPTNYSVNANIYVKFIPSADSLFSGVIGHSSINVNKTLTVIGKGYKMIPQINDLIMCDFSDSITTTFKIKDSNPDLVNFSAKSSNNDLIKDTAFKFSGTGNTKQLILYPESFAYGSSNITVIGEDQSNYKDSITFTLYKSFASANIYEIQPIVCHDEQNAIVGATVNAGEQPYQFSLNGGPYQTSEEFTGLDSGDYYIIFTDALGCVDTTNILQITNPQPLEITDTIVENEQTVDDGSIAIQVNGGVSPYQYNIDSGAYQSDSVFTGLSYGIHKIGIKDNNGCTLEIDIKVGHGNSIDEAFTMQEIIIYPNPNKGCFNIEIPADLIKDNEFSFNIFNETGKIIYKGEINNNIHEININNTSPGSYYLEISSDESSEILPFIIK